MASPFATKEQAAVEFSIAALKMLNYILIVIMFFNRDDALIV